MLSHSCPPILFLIFNRPVTTQRVFDAIRLVKPAQLFVASDGPRDDRPGEAEKCEQARRIIEAVDWDCEVLTLYREKNLGCGKAVSSAIGWFFEHVEEGIILEDDVVPNLSFFPFCEELLERYRTDQRIGMISGNNHYGVVPNLDSYFFAKSRGCWGWATWRRAWIQMDIEMKWISSQYRRSILSNMGYSDRSIPVWENNIASILAGRVSAWDWQWYMSMAAQNQLCIIPAHNQVANIGFGDDATHTFGSALESYVQTKLLDFPLRHPTCVVPNEHFDFLYEQARIPKPQKFFKRFIYSPFKMLAKYVLRVIR